MKELGKLSLAHLARGHCELGVMELAEASYISVDGIVIGRVDEYACCTFAFHQQKVGPLIQSVAADKPAAAEQPEIVRLSYPKL